MVRLIIYAILGFLVWKILQSVGGLMKPRPPREEPRVPPKTPPQDLRNVQDAEFEDLTPKKEGGAGPRPG